MTAQTLATLVIKDQYAPNLIGVLLALAGVGYMVDSMSQFLMSNYTDVEDLFAMVVVIPGVVGELAFTVWLLWKGGRHREEHNAST